MKKFWMIIRASGETTSTKRHESLEDAKKEAERLCVKEKAEFITLEATSIVGLPRPPLNWTEIEKEK